MCVAPYWDVPLVCLVEDGHIHAAIGAQLQFATEENYGPIVQCCLTVRQLLTWVAVGKIGAEEAVVDVPEVMSVPACFLILSSINQSQIKVSFHSVQGEIR
jgi:ABC-type transport system involved in cytochrome c biogenesis permease component